jgi:DNA-binding PadR family transcriptional regulator
MRRASRSASENTGPVPLTTVEFHVLLSVSDGDRHGYAILQDVADRTGNQLRLRTGTLYTVIKRMLDNGWLVETEGRPAGAERDERRRYYRLAPQGREVLRAEAKRLEALVAMAHDKRVLARSRKPAAERG